MIRPKLTCLITIIAFLGAAAVHGAEIEISSPQGTVRFQLSTGADGHLLYSVRAAGQERLLAAPLGVLVDGVDLGAAAKAGSAATRSINEVFPWRGNKSSGTNACRVAEIPISNGAGTGWTLETRVFEDGVGFRYRVPGSGKRTIKSETTQFRLPREATVWIQTDTSGYEGVYHSHRADQVPLEEESNKRKRPTHIGLPMTVEYPDGGFGLLSEAALYNYSGLTLRPQGDARFAAAFEDDPSGWTNDGPIVSPWRVILLGKDLNALVNSDVIASLCEPPDPALFPDGMNTHWIKPGKAPCTWMVFGNDGAQWDRQKWFVDLSAATGCEHLLVDAGWRTEKWGWMKGGGDLWARAAELCRYAAERNVGIVLWHAYPEGRDDGPGLTTVEAREELFRRCREAGVKGVKIDFFNSESKEVIAAYEDLLRRSAKYQLMINFHGANKPTGEPRTWPNEITREGIREQEYVLWESLPLTHYGALPFTRMAVGHADFLPGYVQPKFLKNTTSIFQMASVIVFSSPFLCWPDNPQAYLDSPLLQFVRTVPVTWDETRVLPGSRIGDTVAMARRKAEDWYVAVLNCRAEPRQLQLDLSPLRAAGSAMTVYRDDPEGPGCQIQTGKPPLNGKVQLDLRAGGGFVVSVLVPRKYEGWR